MKAKRRTAALLTLGAVALAPAVASAQATAPRVTKSVHVTSSPEEVPGRSYTSPAALIDPENPLTMYAGGVDVRSQRCVLLRSTNGGLNWVRSKESPSPAGFPFCTHDNGFVPMSFLAMGRDSTLYFLHIAWDTQDGGRSENRSVLLARSTNGGDSWQSTPVHVTRGKTGTDVEKNLPTDLVIDTTSGPQDIVYVAYTASYPNPLAPPATRPGQPLIATSVDGGKTFGEPVNVIAPYHDDVSHLPTEGVAADQRKKENFGGGGTQLAVDAGGKLYAALTRSSANITPLAPPPPILLATSTDKGKTFNVSELHAANAEASGPTALQMIWSPEGAAGGSLHIVWEGKLTTVQGDRDTLYRRSTDGGKTWGEPKVINDDDPKELHSQTMPNIAVAPDGRLQVAWFDHRNGNGVLGNDVYAATSSDSGVTWSKNIRVSDQLIDRNIGVWKPGTGGDVRQPPGLSATNELALVLWDDTRNGDDTTQSQDVYAGVMQFEAVPASGLPKGAGYALAVVLGVTAVGGVMLILALLMRRRRGADATPDEPAAAKKEPVTAAES